MLVVTVSDGEAYLVPQGHVESVRFISWGPFHHVYQLAFQYNWQFQFFDIICCQELDILNCSDAQLRKSAPVIFMQVVKLCSVH